MNNIIEIVKSKIVNEPKFINYLLVSIKDFLYDLSNQWKIAGKVNWANSLFICARDLQVIIDDLAEIEDEFFLTENKDKHPSKLNFNSVEDILNIHKQMKKDFINSKRYFYDFTELNKNKIIDIYSKELSSINEKCKDKNSKLLNDHKISIINFLDEMKKK